MIALGIGVATVAAFIVSSVYYSLMPGVPTATGDIPESGRPAPWQIAAELVRSAITAGLVAGLLGAGEWAGEWDGAAAGALFGLVLWVLPFVILTGSVVWERVPVPRAALHIGDWLVKLVVIGALVGLFV
jgi:hypothetical protein